MDQAADASSQAGFDDLARAGHIDGLQMGPHAVQGAGGGQMVNHVSVLEGAFKGFQIVEVPRNALDVKTRHSTVILMDNASDILTLRQERPGQVAADET